MFSVLQNLNNHLPEYAKKLAQAKVLKTDPAVVNAQLLRMFSGKVNDISTIHSFLDKATAAMVSDTLNTVKKIHVPLKGAPDGITDQGDDDLSRQDGVQTDLNMHDDQSKMTAMAAPSQTPV